MARLLSDPARRRAVSRFERGDREPNLFVILEYAKLARVHGITSCGRDGLRREAALGVDGGELNHRLAALIALISEAFRIR